MATRGRSARLKGKSYELDTVAWFKEIGWPEAKRNFEFRKEEAADGVDLLNTEPFAIQCKSYAKPPAPLAVLKRTKGKHPIAFFKVTSKGEYVVMNKATLKMLLLIFASQRPQLP